MVHDSIDQELSEMENKEFIIDHKYPSLAMNAVLASFSLETVTFEILGIF